MNRVIIATCMLAASSLVAHAQTDSYGWLNNETLETRYGKFEFKNGYPAGDATARLLDMQKLNRAVEVYTTQMMRVSEIAVREGMRSFGSRTPQQVVIWEKLMDARTVLLTANTETVYALSHLELKTDGPTVIEAPPHMLGFVQDGFQRYLADIGPLGRTRAQAENSLSCRRVIPAACPTAISFLARRPTLRCSRSEVFRWITRPIRPLL